MITFTSRIVQRSFSLPLPIRSHDDFSSSSGSINAGDTANPVIQIDQRFQLQALLIKELGDTANVPDHGDWLRMTGIGQPAVRQRYYYSTIKYYIDVDQSKVGKHSLK